MSAGRSIFIAVLLLAIIALAGALFVPLPRTVNVEYELVPNGRAVIIAPFDGVLADVADAGTVEEDAVLARYDLVALEARRTQLESERDELVKKLEAPIPPVLLEAVTTAETAEKEARANWEKAKKKEKAKAKAALDEAVTALKAAKDAARPTPNAQLEEPLAKLNAQLAAVSDQLAASTIAAPRAGAFMPSAHAKDPVSAKQVIGELVDSSTLLARVKLPDGETAKKGRLLTLVFPLARKTYELQEDARDGFVSVEVNNADGALKAGAKGAAELEGEQRPYIAP